MRILGIDPGLQTTGFGIIESDGPRLHYIASGTIRVATIYSIGLHDLPPYMKKFLKGFPTVKIHVEYRRANQVYEDVLGNAVDLGLVAYPNKDPRLEIVAFMPVRPRLGVTIHSRTSQRGRCAWL